MSKRRHNFGTKRFKEKSLFIFHARIALKSLILLFVRLIARGARIGKTHTHTHTHRQTDRQTKYCNPLAHARRGLITQYYYTHSLPPSLSSSLLPTSPPPAPTACFFLTIMISLYTIFIYYTSSSPSLSSFPALLHSLLTLLLLSLPLHLFPFISSFDLLLFSPLLSSPLLPPPLPIQ